MHNGKLFEIFCSFLFSPILSSSMFFNSTVGVLTTLKKLIHLQKSLDHRFYIVFSGFYYYLLIFDVERFYFYCGHAKKTLCGSSNLSISSSHFVIYFIYGMKEPDT